MDINVEITKAFDTRRCHAIGTMTTGLDATRSICAAVSLSMHIQKSELAESGYEFTKDDRKIIAAAAKIIGYNKALFGLTKDPVINDAKLVQHLLSKLSAKHKDEALKACAAAIKAGHIGIAELLVDWLVSVGAEYSELYQVFLVSIREPELAKKVFDSIVKAGHATPILFMGRIGAMDLHYEFMSLVATLDGETKEKVFEYL